MRYVFHKCNLRPSVTGRSSSEREIVGVGSNGQWLTSSSRSVRPLKRFLTASARCPGPATRRETPPEVTSNEFAVGRGSAGAVKPGGRGGDEGKGNGAWGRIRTTDTRIFNPLLYQLSYPGEGPIAGSRVYRRASFGSPARARPRGSPASPRTRRRRSDRPHFPPPG